MANTKSRKMNRRQKNVSKRGFFKKLKNTTSKTIPVVKSGLKKIGKTAIKSAPIIEKGFAALYDTVVSGLNLGVKGVKKGIHMISSKKRHNKRSSRRH